MVTFYEINADGTPGKPVLFLDTLKVSTIEQTASTAEARGGKGNPVLISWDYGKEINVSIEDALFSPKSMNLMFGSAGASLAKTTGTVTKSAKIRMQSTSGNEGNLPTYFEAEVYDASAGSAKKRVYMASTVPSGAPANSVAYGASGITLKEVWLENDTEAKASDNSHIDSIADWTGYTPSSENAGKIAYVKYDIAASKSTITISGNSFPGTYYVTGDTYARSDVDGKDQFFQFIIPKAKMNAENTISLEAEGDPSVFNMSLRVLRPESGEMMKLVQYDLTAPAQG